MSESQVPTYVDTRKIFLQQGTISGQVSLDRLVRFREYLADSNGSVRVDLRFDTNDSNQQLITGGIQAEVQVICQRCLEPLIIELSDNIKLVLLRDEADAERLNSELDPWICLDNKLDLASLVEEQLILCLPIVSYHRQDCLEKLKLETTAQNALTDAETKPKNPFSILKSLKESDRIN